MLPAGGHGGVQPRVPPVLSSACSPGVVAEIVPARGGNPITTQCTNGPFGASGSSTTTATDLVSVGTALHEIVGAVPGPSHVWARGRGEVFVKSGVRTAS